VAVGFEPANAALPSSNRVTNKVTRNKYRILERKPTNSVTPNCELQISGVHKVKSFTYKFQYKIFHNIDTIVRAVTTEVASSHNTGPNSVSTNNVVEKLQNKIMSFIIFHLPRKVQ